MERRIPRRCCAPAAPYSACVALNLARPRNGRRPARIPSVDSAARQAVLRCVASIRAAATPESLRLLRLFASADDDLVLDAIRTANWTATRFVTHLATGAQQRALPFQLALLDHVRDDTIYLIAAFVARGIRTEQHALCKVPAPITGLAYISRPVIVRPAQFSPFHQSIGKVGERGLKVADAVEKGVNPILFAHDDVPSLDLGLP